MLEIESSKLVAAKGDAKDKAFAEQMIKGPLRHLGGTEGLGEQRQGASEPSGGDGQGARRQARQAEQPERRGLH
jgi:hypothetical protein